MEQMENLVREFLTEEGMTLRNALAYAGIGMSKSTGQAAEIVGAVGFSESPYSPERQRRMAEILGEMLFYWHVMASTLDVPFEEIIAEYISSYEATKVKVPREKITLQDMMEMRKHVKANVFDEMEAKREIDNKEKKKMREQML
ncbi:MAG: hypothetical protein FWE38_00735 [Firmicutes bacterium]|nr:hypothetical protein [Bacillota bacterium]